MLSDSRAKALIVSEALLPQSPACFGKLPFLKHVIVSGNAPGHIAFKDVLAKGSPELAPAPTTCDDACFWHLLLRLDRHAEGHGARALEHGSYGGSCTRAACSATRRADVVFSAAKLFFAYGLGKRALLYARGRRDRGPYGRAARRPRRCSRRLREKKPTLFFGVPTLYAAMLASPEFPGRSRSRCVNACRRGRLSTGADRKRPWKEKTGVEIRDGIGIDRNAAHLSLQRPDDLRYGTTGKPVPGYELRLVDEHGEPVKPGRAGRAADQRAHRRGCYLEQPRQEPHHLQRGLTGAATSTARTGTGISYTEGAPTTC